MPLTVSKSRFKPKALEYFRRIQETGEEIVLTDHGRPVLRISPYKADPAAALKSLRNSVVRYREPLEPTGEEWDALK